MHWTATLAQFAGLDAKPPPPLPDPPLLSHYLLERTTLPFAILLGAGVLCFIILNARKPAKARRTALIFLLAGIALIITGEFVHTPREKAIESTKELVHAVASGDTRTVDAALAPQAAVYSDASPQGQPKAVILDKVGSSFGPNGQAPIEDHAILEVQAYIANPKLAQVQVKVRTTFRGGGPILSWWRLDMTPKADGRWEVSAIRYLSSSIPFTP